MLPCVKKGFKVIYHPQALVFHDIPTNRLNLNAVSLKFETTAYARSFQTIRNLGKTYPSPTKQEIESIADRYFSRPLSVPDSLRKAVVNGLTVGFKKHLYCFETDSYFMSWVLRENYLDLDASYKNPILSAYGLAKFNNLDWRHGIVR